jgi:probable rRNA maturation factor
MTDPPLSIPLSTHETEIDIAVDDPAWHEILPGAEDVCGGAVLAVMSAELPETPVEISVLLTDNAAVAALNQRFRERAGPTNVLSFPNDDPNSGFAGRRLLGDIVLARETVVDEARDQGKKLADHIAHLMVHGAMHLIGYDHMDENEAVAMETKETAILAVMGIADPYAARETGT